MKRSRLLFTLLAGLLLVLAACVGPTSVVFDNQSDCGTIRVDLTNTQNNVTETYNVERGQTLSIEVAPNVVYLYVVDFTAAGENEEGYECTAVQRGQVTVPPGASARFNLTAVTPTPPQAP